jgi:hypothetical protein
MICVACSLGSAMTLKRNWLRSMVKTTTFTLAELRFAVRALHPRPERRGLPRYTDKMKPPRSGRPQALSWRT